MLSKKWKKRIKKWFKLRFLILYPLGVWAVISSYSTDESIIRSIWIILLGLGIRSWANCYAIKVEKLTTSGPYAYIRHPLYLGSFLVMVGFLIMLNVNWIGIILFVLVVIGIAYKMTVREEERILIDKFGNEYIKYQRSVPAFFPTVFPFKGGQKWGPSSERYFRSQEYKLIIWMIILVIIFYLKGEFIVEQENVDSKSIFLIIVAFFLGFIDIVGEIMRKKQKKDV